MKTVSVLVKNGVTLPAAESWLIDETRIVRAKAQTASTSWLMYAPSFSSKDRPIEIVIDTAYGSLGLSGMTSYNVYTGPKTNEMQLLNNSFITKAKNEKVWFNETLINAVEIEYKEGGFLSSKMYVEGAVGSGSVTTTTTTAAVTTTTTTAG